MIAILVELALPGAILLFVLTQLIFPFAFGTPYFPLFKGKSKAQSIAAAREELEEVKHEADVKKIQLEAEELRKRINTPSS